MVNKISVFVPWEWEDGTANGGVLFENTDGLQSTAFGISLGSGIWGEAARDLGKTTSTLTAAYLQVQDANGSFDNF